MRFNIFHPASAERRLTELVDRFMAGETTVAQERRLFRAFAPGRRVPPALEPHREMMQWYASLAPEAAPRRAALPRPAAWMAAAVAAGLLLTVGISYMHRASALPDDYRIYRGSYVIRNGEKITDLAEILPEVKRVEQIVSNQQAVAAREVEASLATQPVLDGVDMDDPEVRAIVTRALNP